MKECCKWCGRLHRTHKVAIECHNVHHHRMVLQDHRLWVAAGRPKPRFAALGNVFFRGGSN